MCNTMTFTFIDLTEERMRRELLAEQYAMSARTKLCMSKVYPTDQRLAMIRDAVQDIKDGMSILDCGFVRPLGSNQTHHKSNNKVCA